LINSVKCSWNQSRKFGSIQDDKQYMTKNI